MPTLILVDGFAGTGKSTAAQHLWLNLARAGHPAVWFHEHESHHPIFEYGEVEELLQLHPGPFEDRLLAGWEAVARQSGGPGVRIIEGSFLQIPVGVMLSMNVSAARIRRLLRRIDSVTAGLAPSLIHLFQPDLRAAFRRLEAVRGRPWLAEMTAGLGQSLYGRTHRVHSLAGLIDFYRRQRAIIDSAFPTFAMRRLSIDISGARWARHERQMASFLGIRPVAARQLRPPDLLRHVGPYRGTTTGAPGLVTTDARGLYLHLPATRAQRLLPVADGHFCVESLPIDIRFSYDRKGHARRFAYESRMVNEILSETSWSRA
ncbi:MAG: hypothetical protein ABJA98_22695 [Acidobacteriota bacterium]